MNDSSANPLRDAVLLTHASSLAGSAGGLVGAFSAGSPLYSQEDEPRPKVRPRAPWGNG